MKSPLPFITMAALAASALLPSLSHSADDTASLRQAFAAPPQETRPMMRWWWFGPAVTKTGIEREMRAMRDGGIGGFEVQPMYPLSLDDEARGIKNLRYLSPEFLEALRFTAEKAHELGLRFDLTLGTGWPYGGPSVPIEQAASRLRCDKVAINGPSRRVRLPDIGAGERFIAAFAMPGKVELTDIRDGALWLPESGEAPKEVWCFVASRTGQQVKRAAFGAEGFVFDHYDRSALDNFLKTVGDPLLDAVAKNPPYSVFCDSLEVYGNDWTGDFLTEFQKRRGYDLKPHLPDLFLEPRTGAKGIEHDWAQTLSELLEERFIAPLQAWAKSRGTLLRLQSYGTPPATLSSNRFADLIEGEGREWKTLSHLRWATSAAHIFDRPVVSSEVWTWLHSPSFAASPLDLKAEADRHFLSGVNHLIGHGWPYTAEGADYPGWRLYAAGVYNDKNPWYMVMPEISQYLQRCSYILRQGRPVNDVALYLPDNDNWAHLVPGTVDLWKMTRERLGPDVIPQILGAGFNFDAIDDRALLETSQIEGDTLRVGAGRYRVLVLPYVGRLTDATMRKIEAFVAAGGKVIATRRTPMLKPGANLKPADHASILEASRRLFEGPNARAHFLADEKLLGKKLTELLQPDVSQSTPSDALGFVHRSTASSEIYFVANTGADRLRTTAVFRASGLNPEWWDVHSGAVRPAAITAQNASGVSVELDLAAYESRVLVFSKTPAASAPAPAAPLAQVLDLSTDWQIRFGPSAKPAPMPKLSSWTDDESTRYFSGVATYEKTFNAPDAVVRGKGRLVLDFGEGSVIPPEPASTISHSFAVQLAPPVREAAVITINGKRAGVLWCAPYTLDVTGLLSPGENRIEVRVANLALNHMAGRPLPDYRLLNLRFGERFIPQDMDRVKPQPAGLFGPVRLLGSAEKRP